MRKTLLLAAAVTALAASASQAVETADSVAASELTPATAAAATAGDPHGYTATYNPDRPLPPGWGPEATIVFRRCPDRHSPTCCEHVWDGYCSEKCCPPPLEKPPKRGHGFFHGNCFQGHCCQPCMSAQPACNNCAGGCAAAAGPTDATVESGYASPEASDEESASDATGWEEEGGSAADGVLELPNPSGEFGEEAAIYRQQGPRSSPSGVVMRLREAVRKSGSAASSAFGRRQTNLPLPAGVATELEQSTGGDDFGAFRQVDPATEATLAPSFEAAEEPAGRYSWHGEPSARVSSRPMILRRLFDSN